MPGYEDESLQTDLYIDALLATHGGLPARLPAAGVGPPQNLRRTIELLEAGLPRFHPSFLFEEALAARLRAAALGQRPASDDDLLLADLIELPAAGVGGAAGLDRRLLVGGAIASGVSLAGAAVVAWRMRERTRPRRRWLA